jgi:hypothetical protein
MGRSYHARVDERVETLNGDLGTPKAKMVETLRKLGAGRGREEERRPNHVGSTGCWRTDYVLALELEKWGRRRGLIA